MSQIPSQESPGQSWANDPQSNTLLERYQRLLGLSQDLSSTLDLDSLLNRIVHSAADLSGAEAASILLYDQVKDHLYFRAASNLDTPVMNELAVPVNGSIAGWIVSNRQPVIIGDAQKDSRHFHGVGRITNIETRSLLGVPLLRKDRVMGVLEVINKRRGNFSAEDQELLMALGAQAAIAIENARLFKHSDLISEFVHELRTPLASLTASAYILLRPEIASDRRTKIIQTMQQEISRLSEMASSFLDLAKLESGRIRYQFTSFDIAELMEECCSVMREKIDEKRQELNLEITQHPLQISADRDKLKQVILNLLSNSSKYSPQGAVIRLTAAQTPDEVILQVKDNGRGIPTEFLSHLFEKYYRVPSVERDAQGTGLGLFICKRIIDAHRGKISVESASGQGMEVTVRLPLIA